MMVGELERNCYDTGRGQEFDVISVEIHAYQIGHGGSGRNARVIGRIPFMSGYVRPVHLAKDEIIPRTRMPIIRETRAAHIAKAPVVERYAGGKWEVYLPVRGLFLSLDLAVRCGSPKEQCRRIASLW